MDPLASKYPWYTPYSFAGNKPIWAKDIDGGEERYYQYDLSITNRGRISVSNFKEIKEKRAGFSWENTSYGYGASFKIHHEPVGQFGPGRQYNVSLHIQNQHGTWEDRTLSYFIPRETLLEKLGFTTQKEKSREGGIIFSSKAPFAGRENSLNPTAKHPDRYIVPIDEIISGFNASNAAAEKSPANLVELIRKVVTAYGLGQDIGEKYTLPIQRNIEKSDISDTMPNNAVINGKVVPGSVHRSSR